MTQMDEFVTINCQLTMLNTLDENDNNFFGWKCQYFILDQNVNIFSLDKNVNKLLLVDQNVINFLLYQNINNFLLDVKYQSFFVKPKH